MNNIINSNELITILVQIAIVFASCSPLIICLILKFYLPGYLREKGKNLATKDDIGEITKKIEQVKTEYAKELEQHRSGIWLEQQRIVWLREEFALKLDTYKKSVFLVNQCNDLIADLQVTYASRETNGLISQFKMESEKNKEYFRGEYNSAMSRLAEANTKLDQLKIDLKETCSILEIYFEDNIASLLRNLLNDLIKATDFHWEREKFKESLQKYRKQHTTGELSFIAQKCISEYLGTASRFNISVTAPLFLASIQSHMKNSRTKIVDIGL